MFQVDEKTNIFPLFAIPVMVMDLDEEDPSLVSIQQMDYYVSEYTSCSTTYDRHVLKHFPDAMSIVKKQFARYCELVLRQPPEKFKMTTSWGTKTDPQCRPQWHEHVNSMYSGVYYYDDMSPGSMIEFMNPYSNPYFVGPPDTYNVFNSSIWRIEAIKNRMVFFPSYIRHRVVIGDREKTRWSLAFNFYPNGILGDGGDSSAHIEVLD